MACRFERPCCETCWEGVFIHYHHLVTLCEPVGLNSGGFQTHRW